MDTAQIAFRSLNDVGLIAGAPSWEHIPQQKPAGQVRHFAYSTDGRFIALACPACVQVLDTLNGQIVLELPLKGVIEVHLSPKGTYVSTWERAVKLEDGSGSKNLRVWNVQGGEEATSFSQKGQDGWALQFTEDESRAVRMVSNEVQVYNPANFSEAVVDKLRVEGLGSVSLSPGRNPQVAVFIPEKKGAPASVRVHGLTTLQLCSSQKNFFKADRITMKWNKIGTSILFLTQTDVDKSGKSYYGETNLYLLSPAAQYDCHVTLDRQGGIHDFAWSPNGKEFIVCFGVMPAKTVLFDQRANPIHDFGVLPRNFVSFNPQGRLICVAGFGNLAGQVDIWDRDTLKKSASFEAPNSTQCDWSPDGRFLLCGTLSPRLRVDNGVRVFHHSGALIHIESMQELYQVSWKPIEAAKFPFRAALSPAPAPSPNVATHAPPKPIVKSAGAYRPPGARGTATPTFFKREDEGGAAVSNGETSYFSRYQRKVPGAPDSNGTNGHSGDQSPHRRGSGRGGYNNNGDRQNNKRNDRNHNANSAPATPAEPDQSATGLEAQLAASNLSAEDKKKRALQKKLSAIDALKRRRDKGEVLEKTQLSKIAGEGEVKKELEALG